MGKTLNDCFGEYLGNIAITSDVKKTLEDARKKVKEALVKGISAETEKEGQRVRPRFMTQGSAGYGTQNMPCKTPKQQVDYDYGCYLPLSYLEDGSKPRKAAKDFFEMVGKILRSLARDNEWKYEEHKKCCRLVLNDSIHFDVPLYSVPPDQMKTIKDAALESVAGFSRQDSEEEKDLEWDELPTESIMLAINDGNHGGFDWVASDPRKLNIYFYDKPDESKAIYRILKGWRDFNWPDGDGPSSIFLMSLAEKINSQNPFSNDIEAELQKVLVGIERLELPLNKDDCNEVWVENPADPDDKIRCKKPDYKKLQKYAMGFKFAVQNPFSTSLTETCAKIQHHLGDRFPNGENKAYIPNNREAPKTYRAG